MSRHIWTTLDMVEILWLHLFLVCLPVIEVVEVGNNDRHRERNRQHAGNGTQGPYYFSPHTYWPLNRNIASSQYYLWREISVVHVQDKKGEAKDGILLPRYLFKRVPYTAVLASLESLATKYVWRALSLTAADTLHWSHQSINKGKKGQAFKAVAAEKALIVLEL